MGLVGPDRSDVLGCVVASLFAAEVVDRGVRAREDQALVTVVDQRTTRRLTVMPMHLQDLAVTHRAVDARAVDDDRLSHGGVHRRSPRARTRHR